MQEIEYFRNDKFQLTNRSDKALGSAREIDGIELSKEMEEWLIAYTNVPIQTDTDLFNTGSTAINIHQYLMTKEAVASVIYDGNLMFLTEYFPRDTFIKHYQEIIDIYKNAGTTESYAKLANLAVPNSSVVVTTPSAGVVNIDVTLGTTSKDLIVDTASGEELLHVASTVGGDEQLQIVGNVEFITAQQVYRLLTSLNVNGREIHINFN